MWPVWTHLATVNQVFIPGVQHVVHQVANTTHTYMMESTCITETTHNSAEGEAPYISLARSETLRVEEDTKSCKINGRQLVKW
jgi:hypothetical protein